MQNIIENPGLQHIVRNSLSCLDKKSITSFRLLNQDCKTIVDDSLFSLKKLSQIKNVPKDLIDDWKKIIRKLYYARGCKELQQEISSEVFKMYCKSEAKYPLELAYKLAETKTKPNLVKAILENADPTSYIIAPPPLIGNLRPIHIAAAFGYVQTTRNIIYNSDSIDFQDEHGMTPMFLAAQNSKLEIVQLLLDFWGNPLLNMSTTPSPNVPNKIGRTPIHSAAFNGHTDVIKLLISSTDTHSLCDAPNVPDKKGATPITAAASNGHIDVVKLLITKTDTPNIPDKKGMTPITAAASNGHIDVVKLLMSKTDTPNAPDNVGDTPIMTAAYNGHMDVVKLLMSTTDTPNAAANDGWTPIHSAVSGGHIKIVQLLMSTTDTPNVPDNNGRTPLRIAKKNNFQEIQKLFT